MKLAFVIQGLTTGGAEKNLIAIRGCVPGANGGVVELTKTATGK